MARRVVLSTAMRFSGAGPRCGTFRGPVTEPGFTQTGSNLTALVSPHVLLHMQGVWRTSTLGEPLSTQVASCAQDFIASQRPVLIETAFSHDSDARARDAESPLATQSTRQTYGVALPAGFVATLRGTSPEQVSKAAHGLGDALQTITAGGVHAGLVSEAAILSLRDYKVVNQLVTGVEGPLPTQVATSQAAVVSRSPFVASYYGGSTVVAGVDESLNTVTGTDRHALVDSGDEEPIDVNDWYFRMLVPREIQAGMGFPSDYIVTGNSREQVKQLGNAVTPEVPNILLSRCIASLHPELAS